MHYTMNYAPYKGHVKRQMAIADCKFYLGDAMYDRVLTTLRAEARKMTINRTNIRTLQNMLPFCGIQGYPARALVFHALRTK